MQPAEVGSSSDRGRGGERAQPGDDADSKSEQQDDGRSHGGRICYIVRGVSRKKGCRRPRDDRYRSQLKNNRSAFSSFHSIFGVCKIEFACYFAKSPKEDCVQCNG